MLTIAKVLKEKCKKNHRFCSVTKKKHKLVNEVANYSARVSGQDRKKPPALGANQIAGFGGFRPLASLEKNILYICHITIPILFINYIQHYACRGKYNL